MAFAPTILEHQHADKGPGTTKLSPEDQAILKQPYAIAVQTMGFFRTDLILHAVKLLQNQERPIKAPTLLIEAEDLERLERKGRQLPSLEVKQKKDSDGGSDGESDDSDDSSLDYQDANNDVQPAPSQARNGSDLETDCAPPEASKEAFEMELGQKLTDTLREPTMKKAEVHREAAGASRDKVGKDVSALKQKLHVLRSENRRLKERQLCKNCHTKQVSITFLPCGHYSYCYDCGQRFSTCPVCRKTILADVKTFMA